MLRPFTARRLAGELVLALALVTGAFCECQQFVVKEIIVHGKVCCSGALRPRLAMSDRVSKIITRTDYLFFISCPTRWSVSKQPDPEHALKGSRSDNDQYSHINNALYYHFFDACVNKYLIEHCSLVPSQSTSIGLVVSSHCQVSS